MLTTFNFHSIKHLLKIYTKFQYKLQNIELVPTNCAVIVNITSLYNNMKLQPECKGNLIIATSFLPYIDMATIISIFSVHQWVYMELNNRCNVPFATLPRH